jgi:small-conductance mechanosensitive channel
VVNIENIENVQMFGRLFVQIAIILVATFGAILISRFILKRWLWPAIRKSRTDLDKRILNLLKGFLLIIIFLLGLQAIIGLIEESISTYIGFLDRLFFFFYWVTTLYIIFRLINLFSDFYLFHLPRRDGKLIDKRAVQTVRNVLLLVIGFFAVMVLLERFGITGAAISTSLAALGIGGIILGLAAQTALSNIISGIVLLIDHPFKVGDRIRIELLDTWGDVLEIGWRSTRVLTRDNRLVAIPNSVIGEDLVTNYSTPSKMFRVETDVIVSYGADIECVRNLILNALKQEDWIMHEEPVQALLLEFSGSGVVFKVRCWIENYVDIRVSLDMLNTAIYKALLDGDIELSTYNIVVGFTDLETGSIVSSCRKNSRNK